MVEVLFQHASSLQTYLKVKKANTDKYRLEHEVHRTVSHSSGQAPPHATGVAALAVRAERQGRGGVEGVLGVLAASAGRRSPWVCCPPHSVGCTGRGREPRFGRVARRTGLRAPVRSPLVLLVLSSNDDHCGCRASVGGGSSYVRRGSKQVDLVVVGDGHQASGPDVSIGTNLFSSVSGIVTPSYD